MIDLPRLGRWTAFLDRIKGRELPGFGMAAELAESTDYRGGNQGRSGQ